jgi:hypothetical protein
MVGFFTKVVLALSMVSLASAAQQSSSGDSSPTSGDSPSTNPDPPEVVFLQTMQTAKIASMNCLITLVNMTYNPIGDCLGLSDLANLVVAPNSTASFSTQLDGYLTNACATTCSDAQVGEAQGQLASSCGGDVGQTQLVTVVKAVLDNYSSSYRTLACMVHL